MNREPVDKFFENLTDFLPKFVSMLPSYELGLVVFITSMVITRRVYTNTVKSESSVEGKTEVEQLRVKAMNGLSWVVPVIISFVLAEATVDVSFYLRNFVANRNHITWSKWARIYRGA
jgi:hypothetical protein